MKQQWYVPWGQKREVEDGFGKSSHFSSLLGKQLGENCVSGKLCGFQNGKNHICIIFASLLGRLAPRRADYEKRVLGLWEPLKWRRKSQEPVLRCQGPEIFSRISMAPKVSGPNKAGSKVWGIVTIPSFDCQWKFWAWLKIFAFLQICFCIWYRDYLLCWKCKVAFNIREDVVLVRSIHPADGLIGRWRPAARI